MKIIVHTETYTDNGDGTFSVDVSKWRSFNLGEPEKEYRARDTHHKPSASPTPGEVLAFFRGMFPAPRHDVT